MRVVVHGAPEAGAGEQPEPEPAPARALSGGGRQSEWVEVIASRPDASGRNRSAGAPPALPPAYNPSTTHWEPFQENGRKMGFFLFLQENPTSSHITARIRFAD